MAVVNGPSKNPSAGTVARPATPTGARARASSASSAAGQVRRRVGVGDGAADGAAVAHLDVADVGSGVPEHAVVDGRRVQHLGVGRRARRRTGARRRSFADAAQLGAAGRCRPACPACASRSFSSGSRLWPPAMTLAPSSAARIAQRLVDAARPGCTRRPPGSCLASLRGLHGAPDLLGGERHVEMADAERAQRVDDRVGHGRRCWRCSRPRRRP